ncbi:hypothetical protein [Plantactinospora sp. KLBMP9567]|uniref:hypothetical protein n=1 Tax=Plantactinospora sp. KLBMP9567 TaxID=3085900 RepID=UPI00298159A2|nr:hypothetical protein [Plantactinospora sp. KLBMP9567]MDW5328329.1 hypothetical protein [Plantactinospora sp. KLBMP9567]
MFEPGSRSKQVSTFMLPADEAAFDDALAPAVADLGQWETHDQRARTIKLHDSLPAALHHDRTQAFLRLLNRDGGTTGPLIQYLHTSVVTTDEAVLAATGGRYRATAERPESMSPGRLAFKWFPEDEADCVQRDFVVLVDAAWKALQAVTSPHVETAEGRPLRRYRIGPAAKAWALDRPDPLLHDHALRLRIRLVRRVPDVVSAG